MAPRDPSTRFHPYDAAKKPKIHRANGGSNKKNDTTLPKLTQQSGSGLSINDLKRRIRDVKRLLARHADLLPEARIVQERALAGYERDLEGEQERRARSEMIKKYHFVRFLGAFLYP
jgi:rRNA-processing protein Efg1